MSDTELAALATVVAWQTAIINADVAKFGECHTDPRTPEVLALHAELKRREDNRLEEWHFRPMR